jgi:hypothetical protein
MKKQQIVILLSIQLNLSSLIVFMSIITYIKTYTKIYNFSRINSILGDKNIQHII